MTPALNTMPYELNIRNTATHYLVRLPYNRRFIELAKQLGGWFWPKQQCWCFRNAYVSLEEILAIYSEAVSPIMTPEMINVIAERQHEQQVERDTEHLERLSRIQTSQFAPCSDCGFVRVRCRCEE